MRTCYHDDAIDMHGGFAGSVEKFLDWAFAYHADQKLHQHTITNVTIELDGDTAHVESYYVFYGSYPEPDDTLAVAGGRYVDRFEYRDERWAISRIACAPPSGGPTPPRPTGGRSSTASRLVEDITASRDRDDVSYLRPLELHHAPRNIPRMTSLAEPTPWLAAPVERTPERRRPSIRRTTTHDCTRPEGLDGPVTVVATGRDLLTRADGSTEVLDAARLDVQARYLEGTFLAIAADPPAPGLAGLVGTTFHRGFRPGIEAAIPGESASHSVRFQLLDELPAAVFASGRALRAAGMVITMDGGPAKLSPQQVDLCAGWRDGGAAVLGYTAKGPPLNIGSLAPDVEAGDDPLAWHEHAPLPPHGTCRRRRLDLWEDDGLVQVECFFHDHHVNAEGMATVVHEWTLHATLDPDTLTFTTARRPGPGSAAIRRLPHHPREHGEARRPVDRGVAPLGAQGVRGPHHLYPSQRHVPVVGRRGALLDTLRTEGSPR